MNTHCPVSKLSLRGNVTLCAAVLSLLAFGMPSAAQDRTIFFQEGFNDDGDGTRYEIFGRGEVVDGPDGGPSLWDHSFDVTQIGIGSNAPAKRGMVLWTDGANDEFAAEVFSDDAYEILENMVDWAVDGKQGASIGFTSPGATEFAVEELFIRLEDKGHMPYAGWLRGDAADLVIQTTAVNDLADLEIPLITWEAGSHDDSLVSSIGATLADVAEIEAVVPASAEGDPILGGRTGTFPWTVDFAFDMETIGTTLPPGAKLLAEGDVNGETLPLAVTIDEGAPILGAFNPAPEGRGFIVGADMNTEFGDPLFASSDGPDGPGRTVTLFPVDVAGREDVQLHVGLASTDVDFEDVDFIRVSVDYDDSGEFVELDYFNAPSGNEKFLSNRLNGGDVDLNPREFTDVTYDLEPASTVTVQIEAHSTWWNEIVGIDNIRLSAIGGATPLQPGDADQNFTFDQLDIVKVSIANKYLTGEPATWGEGDWDGAPGGEQGNPPAGNGLFDQLDVIAALSAGKYLTGPYAVEKGGVVDDEQTSLVYDANSGELSVDAPASTNLTSIFVTSGSNAFIGDKPAVLDGPFDSFGPDNIFKSTIGSSFGDISFGSVLPAGLSEDAVATDLTASGSLDGGGGLGAVDLVYIPEPSSVLLFIVGLMGLAIHRRK